MLHPKSHHGGSQKTRHGAFRKFSTRQRNEGTWLENIITIFHCILFREWMRGEGYASFEKYLAWFTFNMWNLLKFLARQAAKNESTVLPLVVSWKCLYDFRSTMGLWETPFPLLELVRRNKQQSQLGAWVFHGGEISSRKQVSKKRSQAARHAVEVCRRLNTDSPFPKGHFPKHRS